MKKNRHKNNDDAYMLRCETLAKKLLHLYGLTWRNFAGAIEVKIKGAGHPWRGSAFVFASWEDMLFGIGWRQSLNSFIKCIKKLAKDPWWCRHYTCYLKYQSIEPKLLDFKTLDELDILLTLAGANSVSET